jgi:hypothetical protein
MRCFNVHRIRYDYRFIDIMGLNFFNAKFSIKSMFLKVKACYIHQYRFAYVNIFVTFVPCAFFIDKISIN